MKYVKLVRFGRLYRRLVHVVISTLSLAALCLPCCGQQYWSLASPDSRWHWASADSAIQSARAEVSGATALTGEDSPEAAYAYLRLSELLQFRCDTCRTECIQAADKAYSIAVGGSAACDSIYLMVSFAWDAARERYDPWADRYTEIRNALDTCFACEWCDSIKMGRIIQRVTSSHFSGGSQDIGRAYLRRALGIFERHDSPDSANVLACVWALRAVTDDPESWTLFERAERLSKHSASKKADVYPTPGVIARTKGEHYLRYGDLAAALPSLNDAVELTPSEFPCPSCQVARSQTLLARCLVELGCADEAASHYQEAIALWRTCGEAVPPYFLVSTLTELGEVYLDNDAFNDAEVVLNDALRIAREQSLAEWQDAYARLLRALSRIYSQNERIDIAMEYGWAALELASTIHGPSDGTVAVFQQDLAELLYLDGQEQAAMSLQTTALDLAERVYGPYHPATADGLERMAWMQSHLATANDSFLQSWRKGQPQALRSIENAYRSRFDWLRAAANDLPEYELVQSADEFRRASGQYLDILLQSTDSLRAEVAAPIIYDGKALLWDALGNRCANQREPQTIASDTLRKLRREMQACITLAAREPCDSLKQRLEYLWHRRVHWEREYDIEERLHDPLNAYSPTTLENVQAALPDSAMVLDFVRYMKPITWDSRVPSYALLCVTPLDAKLVDLGPSEPIDSLVSDLRSQCNTPSDLDEVSYAVSSKDLFQRLLGPVKGAVAESRQIFVCADGDLHNLSFGTLLSNDNRYLIENAVVMYLHSSREIVRRESIERQECLGHGWLIVADPAFDSNAELGKAVDTLRNSLSLRAAMAPALQSTWSALSATLAEANMASLLADSEGVVLLSGAAANRSRVLSSLSGNRVLYFATHGFCVLDPNRDLQLSPDMLYLEKYIEHDPMVACGLVLAGANQPNSLGGAEALWTAAEIAGLDLSSVDVAILSACETGVGRVVPGEGVYALRRAFELAGAKATISSLWRIDDTSTSSMLNRIRPFAELPIGLALALAMRGEIETRRHFGKSTHPFFWGAFVVTGDWNATLMAK